MHLYQKILNRLDEERGLAEEMAKISGYSAGNILRRNFRNHKKDFDKFHGLVKVVQALFPDEEIQLMSEFALTVDPNKQTARYLLEYLALHRKYDELNKLIQMMKEAKNTTSKEWAKIYEIDQKAIHGEMNTIEALNELGKITPKSSEMRICIEIMRSYCYIEEQKYDFAHQYVKPLEGMFDDIGEEYIKDIYLGRFYLIVAECHFRNNDIESARLYCNKIMSEVNEKILRAWSRMHYGNSLIIESFHDSLKSFNEGLELAKNYHTKIETHLKRSINFACNYWKKDPLYPYIKSKEAADVHEIAFYAINHGQFKEATRILNEIDLSKLNNNNLGFHYYFRGLITKNDDDFCESVYYFKKSSDFHFINLPIFELKKLGYKDSIIKIMLT